MKQFDSRVLGRLPIWIFLGAVFFVYLIHGILIIDFPFQIEYGEGAALVYADRVRRGLALYPPLGEAPYISCAYTPLYLWVSGKLMGASAAFFWPRLISAVSSLVTAFLIAYCCHKRGGSDSALFGWGFYLISALILYWSFLMRVDHLALCLTVAGLAAVISGRRGGELVASVLFAVAFFVKQSYLAAPVAVGSVLLLKREWKRLLIFGSVYVLGVLVPLFLVNRATGGLMWEHTVVLNGETAYTLYHTSQLWDWGSAYLWSVLPQVVLAVGYLIFGGWRKSPYLTAFWILSLGIALGAGREGGFYNYFLEFHVGVAVLGALGASELAKRWNLAAYGAVLVGFGFGWFTFLSPFLYAPSQFAQYETAEVLRAHYPTYLRKSYSAAALQPWLDHYGGPILAENQGNVTVMGTPPWLCDANFYAMIILSGRWDEERLLQPIREKKFPLIVLQRTRGSQRFTPNTVEAILENYEVVDKAGQDQIFRPR